MRVEVEIASGQRVTCWAVQKTNIAAMTHSRSRTDRVTERLIGTRLDQLAGHPTPTAPAQITRRVARLPNWMVLAVCFYILLAALTTRAA